MTENIQSEQQVSNELPVKKRRRVPWLLLGFLVIIGVGIIGYFVLFYDNSVEEKINDYVNNSFISGYSISEDGQHIVLNSYHIDYNIVKCDGQDSIKDYKKIRHIIISPNGEHIAYIASINNKDCVVYDNIEGPYYDQVRDMRFQYTDRLHLSYLGHIDNKCIVIYDTIESRKYDSVFYPPKSLNNGHWIYCGNVGTKWKVVYDGNEIYEFDIFTPIIRCGSQGQWTCSGQVGDKKHILIDGVLESKYDESWDPVYTIDGLHYAFIAKKDNKCFAVIDGKEQKCYDDISSLALNNDGSHYVFMAKDDKGYYVVKDGVEGNRYTYVNCISISPDGNHYIYIVSDGVDKGNYYVCDGIEIKHPNIYDITRPTYNNDSQTWAAIATYMGGGKSAIINGTVKRAYDDIIMPILFNSSGSHTVYIAMKNNKYSIVHDDAEGPFYDITDNLKYNSDGTHLVYCAEDVGTRTQKWFNEKIYKMYDLKKRCFIVLDNKEQRSYDWVSYPVFTKDNKMIYYGIRDNVLYRITKKL